MPKVPLVAKKLPQVGWAGFSKSNSVFNPSRVAWLTASIQILSRAANFLTRQFAKRTAFLRKREEKKVLQAKPPIVSTLFQSFLDTQRVNLRRVLAKPMKSLSDKRSRPAGPVLGWIGWYTFTTICQPQPTRQHPCSTVRSSATGSNRATMKTPVRPLDPCRRRSTQ